MTGTRAWLVELLRRDGHIDDERVLAAIGQVPREEFVPGELSAEAYADRALPIEHGQTISQPYVVALMTQLSGAAPGKKVLEVGTGSGYQAAVLAATGAEVFSLEIIADLAEQARARLATLGYPVQVRVGDGHFGWPEQAPFDAIVVTAAPQRVPEGLVAQLSPGGRLVLPVGAQTEDQALLVLERQADGTLAKRSITRVRFVPMTGGRGSAFVDPGAFAKL